MLSRFLFAEGPLGWWYLLLWIELIPLLVLNARLFFLPRAGLVAPESPALNGAVLGALALMALTSLGGVILYVRALPGATAVTWGIALAIHFVVWAFLGSALVFAALQALGSGSSLVARRVAAIGATIGALTIHTATLYATWYSRTR